MSKNEIISESSSSPESIKLTWSNVKIETKPSLTETVKGYIWLSTPETLLENVCGIVENKELLALMGPSGSGKTTLLNLLTNQTAKNLRKVSGDIKINGQYVSNEVMSNYFEYVSQTDVFHSEITVKEQLLFQARIKNLNSIETEVEDKLVRYDLKKCQNVKIGLPGIKKGISGGQMRRLTLANALLSKPKILFCDEPTSGIDFAMAEKIMKYLKEYANEGNVVVCTMHQPAFSVFNQCDKLCLLADGKMPFFGTLKKAEEFFAEELSKESINPNPADVYIKAMALNNEDKEKNKNTIDNYRKRFENDERILLESIKMVNGVLPKMSSPYKVSVFVELKELYIRGMKNVFRDKLKIFYQLLMTMITALLGGLIFRNMSTSNDGVCEYEQKNISNISTSLFFSVTTTFLLSVLFAVLDFPKEYPIYHKEQISHVYRFFSYFVAKFFQELPIFILLPIISSSILYYMAAFGCSFKNYCYFVLINIFISLGSHSLGQFLSIIGRNITHTICLAAPVIAIEMLFSGFFLKRVVNSFKLVNMARYLSIFNYGYDLLMINQWRNVTTFLCPFERLTTPQPYIIFNESYYIMPVNNTVNMTYPQHCITQGIQILSDLKIDTEKFTLYLYLMVTVMAMFNILSMFFLWYNSTSFKINFSKLKSSLRLKRFNRKLSIKQYTQLENSIDEENV